MPNRLDIATPLRHHTIIFCGSEAGGEFMADSERYLVRFCALATALLSLGCPGQQDPPPPPTPGSAEVAEPGTPISERPLFVQAILARQEARIVRSQVDAVNSRLEEPVELQEVGAGGQAPVEGNGRVALEASDLHGDIASTNEIDPETGEPYPLSAEGWLTGDDRQARGAQVLNGSTVCGDVEIGQGAIEVEGDANAGTITQKAITRGIVESGLSSGEGFLPQIAGSYAGGPIGKQIEKTADDEPLELERTLDDLKRELRAIAAERGAAVLEPGPDGELGTEDDVFIAERFDLPFSEEIPDPADGGTDWRDITNTEIRRGTLTGSMTLTKSGSPHYFRHIDLQKQDILTLEPEVEIYVVGGEHSQHSPPGVGDGGEIEVKNGAQIVCQGDAKIVASKHIFLKANGSDSVAPAATDGDAEKEKTNNGKGKGNDKAKDNNGGQPSGPTAIVCSGGLALGAPRIRIDARLQAQSLLAFASRTDVDIEHKAELYVDGPAAFGARATVHFRNSSTATITSSLHIEVGRTEPDEAPGEPKGIKLTDGARVLVGGNLQLEANAVELADGAELRVTGTSGVFVRDRFVVGEDCTFAAAPADGPERLTQPEGMQTSLVYIMSEDQPTTVTMLPGSVFVGCLFGLTADITITGGAGEPDRGHEHPGVYGAIAGETVLLEDATLRYDAFVGRNVGDVSGIVLVQRTLADQETICVPQEGVRVTAVDVTGEVLEARTEADGTFLLQGVPGPVARITADGSEIDYGRSIQFVEIVRQEVVEHPRPWILYPLAEGVPASINEAGQLQSEIVITNPDLPGASLTISAGSHLYFPADYPAPEDGELEFSLHEIALVDLPAPLPDGVLPSIVLSFQPEGIEVPEGFTVTFPNRDGLLPGETVDIYELNLETGEWDLATEGVVSPDGSTIEVTLDTWTGPIFYSTGPVVWLVLDGRVVAWDDTTQDYVGVNDMRVSTLGEAVPTNADITSVEGSFLFGVNARLGQLLPIRVTGTFEGGSVSLIFTTEVVPNPESPDLVRTDPFPLVFEIKSPLTVWGSVRAAGRLAAGVTVEAGGVRTETDLRGEFSLSSVRRVSVGTEPGSPAQDILVTAIRSFNNTDLVFDGWSLIHSPEHLTSYHLPNPIELSGPEPSPGTPGEPGEEGVPNDPRTGDPIVVTTLSAYVSADLTQPSMVPMGLKYSAANDMFLLIGTWGPEDHLLQVYRGNGSQQHWVGPGHWGPYGWLPFGGWIQEASRRDVLSQITHYGDGDGQPGNPKTANRAFAYNADTGQVFRFDFWAGEGQLGLVEYGASPIGDVGPGAGVLSEADRFGGVWVGKPEPGASGGDGLAWYYLSETVGSNERVSTTDLPPSGWTALPHELTREPGTERYFLSTPDRGYEEIDPFTGLVLNPVFPGDTSSFVLTTFAPFEDPNQDPTATGRNIFGVTGTTPPYDYLPQGGTRIVAKKRNAPLPWPGGPPLLDPHFKGTETVVFEAYPGWHVLGIAFAPSTRTYDPPRDSLYALVVYYSAGSSAHWRIVELDYDFTQVFVGGTPGTAGTPGTQPVPDTNGDGLIDAIELAHTGHVHTAWDEDGDGLSAFEELVIYGTDAGKWDTDGDGFSDLAEVNGGSDPNDAGEIPPTAVTFDKPLIVAPNTEGPQDTITAQLRITAGGVAHPHITALDLSISPASVAQFRVGGAPASSVTVPQGGNVTIEGSNQGYAYITATNPGDGAVVETFVVAVQDPTFEIDGQCQARNCPCSACPGGIADRQDGAFVNLDVGGFMWSCEVLPGAMGRNGLEPDWTLRYNSRAHSRGGVFGLTPASLACFERIYRVGPTYSYQDRQVRKFAYNLLPSDTSQPGDPAAPEGATAKGCYEVLRDLGTELVLRRPDGTRLHFHPLDDSLLAGCLQSVENRFGDTLTCSYNGLGQLVALADVYGREYTFTYRADGCLSRISEDATTLHGRKVEFVYVEDGGLKPRLSQIRTAPAGATTFKLGYASASVSSLSSDTNVTSVIYPREVADGSDVARIQNVYWADDKLHKQTWGGARTLGPAVGRVQAGGTITYTYGAQTTSVTDRNGNETIYTFDADGMARRVEESTNRSIRGALDPASFATDRTYNSDGELTHLLRPLGNEVFFEFDTSSAISRFAHGNLLEVRQVADGRGNGLGSPVADILRTYTYEPIFQQLRTQTQARGNHPVADTSFSPPIPDGPGLVEAIDFDLDGVVDSSPQGVRERRYSSLTVYDYQEGSQAQIQALAAREGITLTSAQATALSVGADLNQDGATDQQLGRPVELRAPTVLLGAGASQRVRTNFRWNAYGLLSQQIDAEGYVTRYEYSPASQPSAPTGAGSGEGGYLFRTVEDAGPKEIRTTPTAPAPPVQAATVTGWDAVGNLVRRVDPRGIVQTFLVNERNLVESSVLVDLGYETRTSYDANDNVTKVEVKDLIPDALGGPIQDLGWIETRYEYDLLDDLVLQVQDVSRSEIRTIRGQTPSIAAGDEEVTTRHRYDKNQNRILTLSPLAIARPVAGQFNVTSAIYDERDLLWQSTRGGATPEWEGIAAHQDVAGDHPGLQGPDMATDSSFVDANGNVALTVDAKDHGTNGGNPIGQHPLTLGVPGNPAV
ncbi:MAG: hypothetical protein ABIJ09_22680, partial [Pseudomonadota bacterium]